MRTHFVIARSVATAVTLTRLPRLAHDDRLGKVGTHEGPSDLDLLRHAEILSCDLTRQGSNYTYLADTALGDCYALAIYKPRQGEWPLWDFPSGTLYKREYAAYLLSHILDWDCIPLNIVREGPGGIGSV